MKKALFIFALVILAIILPFFLPNGHDGKEQDRNLPWQIETDGQGGSKVFGLTFGVSTISDLQKQFGYEPEIAIIAAPGESGTLEVYYQQVTLGFVLGRLIVTTDLPPAQIAAMKERALKSEYMESSTRKYTLIPADLAIVTQTPIFAMSLIPNSNLDEAAVVQRFGQPAERIQIAEKRIHLLYPEHGLDIQVDSEGKELLQYIAPRNFARLREPLEAKPQPTENAAH
jgi:hypothetical protein